MTKPPKRKKSGPASAKRNKALSPRRQRRQAGRRPAASYGERDGYLRQLGFSTYQAYLASPLWQEIRARKLAKHRRCQLCDRWASQVHHSKYTLQNLQGRSGKWLLSICGGCHLKVEFTPTMTKLTLADASKKTARLKRASRLSAEEMDRLMIARRNQATMNREFRAIVRGGSTLLLI